MKRILSTFCAVLLLTSAFALAHDDGKKEKKGPEQKRAKIDHTAQTSLDRLMGQSKGAKALYDNSFGYAVFDSTKVALGLTGGGGTGVAVEKTSGERTYMKMGSAGIGFGIGAQVYQVVFLFQTEAAFRQFVDKGWEAEAQANAAAGTAGANVASSFTKGIAVFQITEGGLMASADVSGTKYWKNKKLN